MYTFYFILRRPTLRRMYIAAVLLGVFLTAYPAAAQETWVASGLDGLSVNEVYVERSGGIIAATSEGIYRSTDDGANWEHLSQEIGVYNLIEWPDGALYAAIIGDLHRSTDHGRTWTPVAGSPGSSSLKSMAVDSMGAIYLGFTTSTHRSTNGGATWQALTNGLPQEFPDIGILEVVGGNVVVAASWGIQGGDLYASTDRGTNWTTVFSGDLNQDVSAFVLTPSGRAVLAAYSRGIFWASPALIAWTPAQSVPDLGTDAVSSFVMKGNTIYASAGGHGVLRSTDNAVTWVNVNAGIGERFVNKVVVTPTGGLLASTAGGMLRYVESASSVEGAAGGEILCEVMGGSRAEGIAVRLRLPAPEEVRFSVYTMLGGECLRRDAGRVAAGSSTHHIASAGLPAGSYLVRIEAGRTVLVRKLVLE